MKSNLKRDLYYVKKIEVNIVKIHPRSQMKNGGTRNSLIVVMMVLYLTCFPKIYVTGNVRNLIIELLDWHSDHVIHKELTHNILHYFKVEAIILTSRWSWLLCMLLKHQPLGSSCTFLANIYILWVSSSMESCTSF